MAEKSGFFDAHLVNGEYDRVYLAESFAKYFANFIRNGVFGGKSNELMVQAKSAADMSVNVLSGKAWINGYWYENDAELSLPIDVADGVLNRIDSIVIRWNNVERVVRLVVKKGTPASNPSAPTVQRDADYYELKIAQILIKAGATRVTQADVTDTRLDEDVCGLVVGTVQQLDTQEFGKQLGAFIKEFIEYCEDWFSEFENDSNSKITTFLEQSLQRINALLSDGLADINEVVDTGEANIAKVVSDGQTNINAVITAGQKSINDTVTNGQTRIDKVVTDGQTSINNVVSTGTTNINKLISDKTNEVNQVISTSQAKFDKLATDSNAWFTQLKTDSEDDIAALIAELEGLIDTNDLASLNLKIVNVADRVTTLESSMITLQTDVDTLKGNVTKLQGDVTLIKDNMSTFNYLKNMFVQSGPNPGCYYRTVSGENEWVNPPNEVGISYRTTERWNGKPVYQRLFYVGTLPNKTLMSIAIDARFDRIISISGFAVDSDNNMNYPFPIILNGLSPAAVISYAEGDGGEGSSIVIQTNEDISNLVGYITVKYVKS